MNTSIFPTRRRASPTRRAAPSVMAPVTCTPRPTRVLTVEEREFGWWKTTSIWLRTREFAAAPSSPFAEQSLFHRRFIPGKRTVRIPQRRRGRSRGGARRPVFGGRLQPARDTVDQHCGITVGVREERVPSVQSLGGCKADGQVCEW